MRKSRSIALIAVVTLFTFGCYKSTPATADSASSSSTASGKSFNKESARAEILANDSAFVRGMASKNVDSIMCCYDNDAVSIGAGRTVKGVSDLRKTYTEAVKANIHDISFQSGGVEFSGDGPVGGGGGDFSPTYRCQ